MGLLSRLKVFLPGKKALSAEVNAEFDNLIAGHNQQEQTLNNLISDLQSTEDGNSGADYIGSTPISGIAGDSVQEVLENLKALDDSNRSYLLSQIQGTVIGQIPDGSIGMAKLDTEVNEHFTDDVSHNRYGVDTGTANAKVVTLSPVPPSLATGFTLRFKNTLANTGAVTINVNGLGSKSIVKSGGTALASGNLKANGVYTIVYDGTSFILQGEGGSGNLQPNQALAGYTFTNDNGEQVGLGDPNLIAANIKQGISIFGVLGSLGGATIKSIQRGVQNAKLSTQVTISSVDPSKSILIAFPTHSVSGMFPSQTKIRAQLTNATTIHFYYQDGTGDFNIDVSWFLIEFSSGVSVQRGTQGWLGYLGAPSTTTDITISSVDMNKSLILVTYSTNVTNLDEYYNMVRPSFISNTQIRMYRPYAQNDNPFYQMCWQVITFL